MVKNKKRIFRRDSARLILVRSLCRIAMATFLIIIVVSIILFKLSSSNTNALVPLDSGAQIEIGSNFRYILTARYDGIDASGVSGANANLKSHRLVVTDTLANASDGLVHQSETVGTPVLQSDGVTACSSGSVVEGPTYDSMTGVLSFVVDELQAGCQIDVAINFITEFTDVSDMVEGYSRYRYIFSNIASIQDLDIAHNSRPVSASGIVSDEEKMSPLL